LALPRFVADPDVDDALRLFSDLTRNGKHVAVMAHFEHGREMEGPVVREAVRRILDTGAVIAFQQAAANLRVPVLIDLDAPYWSRIRAAFLRWAAKRDLTACVIIQELMLESFAVSLYQEVSHAAKWQLAVTFRLALQPGFRQSVTYMGFLNRTRTAV
jgi:hypothetical protein